MAKITLETPRLLLRPFCRDDADAIFHQWASDPEVTRFLSWNPHPNVEVTNFLLDVWIKEYEMDDTFRCAIQTRDTHELIGAIDVVGYPDGFPEIGYVLSRSHWGKGIMTEACSAFLGELFHRGYPKVIIRAAIDNKASNRVIAKMGGVFQGTETSKRPQKQDEILVNVYWVFPK
ncbi:MAG: GNAT family N-acetyltransferase [Bacillales bacterium]|nr:GNAT family N-acetyltransferase [Bacillales bacterium]MDY5920218.1 GNAT family N-acetyltransferase [Candidatus Enteromonas sp.]